jgi:hypothetical protein
VVQGGANLEGVPALPVRPSNAAASGRADRAPGRDCLALLPPGSDAVRELPPHGARPEPAARKPIVATLSCASRACSSAGVAS